MNSIYDEPEPPPATPISYTPKSVAEGIGHGGFGAPPKRGIPVRVKLLKRNGVALTKREREAAEQIVGELKIERVHERTVEHHSRADIFVFDQYLHHPGRLATLINPVVFAADVRGMIIYGIERKEVPGGTSVCYWQTWQVLFDQSVDQA